MSNDIATSVGSVISTRGEQANTIMWSMGLFNNEMSQDTFSHGARWLWLDQMYDGILIQIKKICPGIYKISQPIWRVMVQFDRSGLRTFWMALVMDVPSINIGNWAFFFALHEGPGAK